MAAPAADAYWFDGLDAAKKESIRQHIRSVPGYTPGSMSQDAYDLWLEYKNKEAQSLAQDNKKFGRMRWLRSKFGTAPWRYLTSPKPLPTTFPALGALSMGFLIGTGINRYLLRIGIPKEAPSEGGVANPEQRLTPTEASPVAPSRPCLSGTWGGTSDDLCEPSGLVEPYLRWQFYDGQWKSTYAQDGDCDWAGMVGIPVHQTLFYATNVCSVHDPVTGVVLHPGEIGKVWGGWSYEWQMPTVIPPTHAPEGEPLPDGDDYTDDDYTAVPAPSSPSDGTLNGRAGPFFDDPRNEDLKRWYEHFWLNDPDPFAQYGTVPDCRGLTHSQCLDLLEEEGFLGTITTTELDWHTADVDVEPEHVVDTDPDGGSEVIVDTEVEIKVNPDEEGMPVIVPAPLPGETSQQYADRLEELGLEPDTIVLPDTSLDPQKGPNEIVGTNPQPGQRVQQGTPITIRLNPPTAPPVGPVPGSCDPHNIRGFNLDPLAVPVGDVFPFGIFGWMADAMSSWGASPVAPSWSIPLGPNLDLPLDLAVMQPVIDYLRPVLLIVSAFGLVWMLAAAALKINAPQGDD